MPLNDKEKAAELWVRNVRQKFTNFPEFQGHSRVPRTVPVINELIISKNIVIQHTNKLVH